MKERARGSSRPIRLPAHNIIAPSSLNQDSTPERLSSPEKDSCDSFDSIIQHNNHGNDDDPWPLRQRKKPRRVELMLRPRRGRSPTQGDAHTIFSSGDMSPSRRPTTGRIDPSKVNLERGVARRPGGYRRMQDYMQDRVLDSSIRIRGSDLPRNAANRDDNDRMLQLALETYRFGKRREASAQRRTSGEEALDLGAQLSQQKPRSPSGSSDEERIEGTLKSLTTFQITKPSSEAVAVPDGRTSTVLPNAGEGVDADQDSVLETDLDAVLAETALYRRVGQTSANSTTESVNVNDLEAQAKGQSVHPDDSYVPKGESTNTDLVLFDHDFGTGSDVRCADYNASSG